MKIKTLPVFSRLADEAEVMRLGLREKLPSSPMARAGGCRRTRWRPIRR